MKKLILLFVVSLIVLTGCGKNENMRSCKYSTIVEKTGYEINQSFEVDKNDNILNLKINSKIYGDENYIKGIESNQYNELVNRFKYCKDIKISLEKNKDGANISLSVNFDEISSDEKIKLFAYFDTYEIKGKNYKNNLTNSNYICE